MIATVGHKNVTEEPSGVERDDRFNRALYHITHDLRATLRALKTVPEWIREDLTAEGMTLSPDTAENLSMLEVQANRADRMLDDLRVFSCVGRGSDPAAYVSLDTVIASIATGAGIPSSFRLNTRLQVPAIFGSENEVEQMLGALISNAIKHHDSDSGTIDVTSVRMGRLTAIVIEDDGPGIPPEFRERVFDMMVTLRARDECEGSGLGLSIAREIAERHGGTIQITDPTHERGCRVEVRWPMHHDFDDPH